MRMFPIYNGAGLLLGHIDDKTLVLGHDSITVIEDVSLKAPDPSDPSLTSTKIDACRIERKQIQFRNKWNDKDYSYFLVAERTLPAWFWKNRGCLEFHPDQFQRIPWR